MKKLLIALLFSQPLLAQNITTTTQQVNGTLTVTDLSASISNGSGVVKMYVRNDSSKPIKAWSLVITVNSGDKGAVPFVFSRLPDLLSTPDLAPGQTVNSDWEFDSQVAVADITVAVDYVLFSDGTQAGPHESSGAKLIGYSLSAVNGYRRNLAKLYREKGVDALVKELTN